MYRCARERIDKVQPAANYSQAPCQHLSTTHLFKQGEADVVVLVGKRLDLLV